MRAVVQRVLEACVRVGEVTVGQIGAGLVVFLGYSHRDTLDDVAYMADKMVNLRIFEDSLGKMNLSVLEKSYSLLAVSQFTLYGDGRKGRRPSWAEAAKAEEAQFLYDETVKLLRKYPLTVETGQFQADMRVLVLNDGPVTLLLDSEKKF